MRENPLAGVKGKEQQAANFSGENFVRYLGEVVAANEAQVFAWSARCQGIDVHALAEPTKLEQLQKDFKEEKKDVKEETKQKLLEKYGGDEHLQAPPKELLLAQLEAYVEYSRKGARMLYSCANRCRHCAICKRGEDPETMDTTASFLHSIGSTTRKIYSSPQGPPRSAQRATASGPCP